MLACIVSQCLSSARLELKVFWVAAYALESLARLADVKIHCSGCATAELSSAAHVAGPGAATDVTMNSTGVLLCIGDVSGLACWLL
jgi:hypothetical protein